MRPVVVNPLIAPGRDLPGLTTRQVVALSAAGAVVAFGAGAAILLAEHWIVRSIGIALYVALPVGSVIWFKWYLDFYVKALRKIRLVGRRSRKRIGYLESILQDSTDIIFTVDTEGYVLKFNKGSEMHFGYTQAEIVGKPLVRLFVNEADERKILNNVLLGGRSVDEEVPMKTAEGETILLNISIAEMKTDEGEIIGLVVTAKDITEKKKLELELRKKNELLSRLAITDSLTELYNVRHFHHQIRRELSRLRRNPGRQLALIMIDIDHFKELNDTEGHQVGDEVLRSLAQVITVCIRRDVDSAFRYGGDELVVILPDTDKMHARIAAERIQKQFGAFKFGRTSLSVGIAEARSDDDADSLIKRTDEALYESKRGGRARITLA
jgi:diguanylate cyclase (GGDEF)-like protein/PAS domain S-box-containing protein